MLILTEYFMTFSEINRLHYYLIFCVFGSLATYLFCLFFLKDYLHISNLTFEEFIFILTVFVISYVPLFLWKYYFSSFRLIRKKLWPTDVEKVRKNSKEKMVGRDLHDR